MLIHSPHLKIADKVDKHGLQSVNNNKQINSSINLKTSLHSNRRYEPHHIVSICENKNQEIGIATYDLQNGHVMLTQFNDKQTYINTLSLLLK